MPYKNSHIKDLTKAEKERTVMRIYKHFLKEYVEPIMGKTTTYQDDLEGVGKSIFGVKFKGVYPSDKIPQLTDLTPYCICNLDKSNEPGSHWVALAKTPFKKEALMYDSFGRGYKKILLSSEHSGNGRIKNTDRDIEQKIAETNCGQRSLSWIMVFDKFGPSMAKLI